MELVNEIAAGIFSLIVIMLAVYINVKHRNNG